MLRWMCQGQLNTHIVKLPLRKRKKKNNYWLWQGFRRVFGGWGESNVCVREVWVRSLEMDVWWFQTLPSRNVVVCCTRWVAQCFYPSKNGAKGGLVNMVGGVANILYIYICIYIHDNKTYIRQIKWPIQCGRRHRNQCSAHPWSHCMGLCDHIWSLMIGVCAAML